MLEMLQRMDGGQMLGLAGILAGAFVLGLWIIVGYWTWTRHASIQANLRREMLASGRPIEEIERLMASSEERQARLEAEARARETLAATELRKEMVARGMSVSDIQQLAGTGTSQPADLAVMLTETLASMVHDGELDRTAVRNLLTMVLQRQPAVAVTPAELNLARITESPRE